MDENTGASVITAIALGTTTDNDLHPVSRLIFAILVLILVYAYLALLGFRVGFGASATITRQRKSPQ